ncbi:MAG: FAD-dependent oxidoreductase, partial [Gemmataceae bacterium]
MTEHPDVLILGGGVIGLTTAWFLSEAGVRVALV